MPLAEAVSNVQVVKKILYLWLNPTLVWLYTNYMFVNLFVWWLVFCTLYTPIVQHCSMYCTKTSKDVFKKMYKSGNIVWKEVCCYNLSLSDCTVMICLYRKLWYCIELGNEACQTNWYKHLKYFQPEIYLNHRYHNI